MDVEITKDARIRRRVLIGTVSNYLGQFLTLGTWFFLTPFLLQRLGPTNYGLWALVGSTVAYGWLFDLGIAGAVVKYVAEYRARGDTGGSQKLVVTAAGLYLLLGLIVAALSLLLGVIFPHFFNVAPEHRTTAVWLAILMGVGVGITIPCSITTAILRGLQRFDLVNVLNISGVLASAVLTVVVLLLGYGVVAMVAINIPITIAMQIPGIWFIRRTAPELHLDWRAFDRTMVRSISRFSSAIFVTQIADRLQTKSDELVIGAFLPLGFVTPYSLARRLSEVAQTLTDQFLKLLLPLASELHAENDQTRLRGLYLTSTRLTLAIFVPVAVVLIMLGSAVLNVWVGETYASYGSLVTILTIASLINTSQWPAGSILQGMARHRWLAYAELCAGLANLVLSIALIKPFGLMGVALGTLIPTVIQCFGFVIPYILRVMNLRLSEVFRSVFLPVLIPATAMILTLFFARQIIGAESLLHLFVLTAGSALVFGVVYLIAGASTYERQTYWSIAANVLRVAQARLLRS